MFPIQELKAKTLHLIDSGRNVLIVGDFNISPYPIDSCHTKVGNTFYQQPIRALLHSMLLENGGAFLDVFRMHHPAL